MAPLLHPLTHLLRVAVDAVLLWGWGQGHDLPYPVVMALTRLSMWLLVR